MRFQQNLFHNVCNIEKEKKRLCIAENFNYKKKTEDDYLKYKILTKFFVKKNKVLRID